MDFLSVGPNSIAAHWLRKYHEAGYAVIPVGRKKRPANGVFDHTAFANKQQTEELISYYETLSNSGMGVITGQVSGVWCLDIDTNDKSVLAKLPRSPCTRIGSKGEGRFFRWTKDFDRKRTFSRYLEHPNENGKREEAVEILTNGHMVVVEAIHPVTLNPYRWGDGCVSLLDISPEDLPCPSYEEILEHCRWFSATGVVSVSSESGRDYTEVLFHDHEKCPTCARPTTRCPHGAHDRIKGMLAGFIAQKKTKESVIEEICAYDLMKHRPIGYLSDKTRSDYKGSAQKTAEWMYMGILKTINESRIKNGLPAQYPAEPTIISIGETKQIEQVPEEQFPEIDGMLGKFKDAILSISRSNQNDMALGAALAIAGTLCANRFKKNGTPVYTTSYILNVASTGAGKGAANDFINEFFGFGGIGNKEHYRLLGISNYSSDAAIIHRLKSQRTRLDVVDEFGQVFKGLSMKGDRKAAVGDCLKALFSAKFSFNGHYTKTNEEEGKCITPSVSLLGSIQPETLINNTAPEMMFDGFMGRFLYFIENENPEWTGNHLNGGLSRDFLDFLTGEALRIFPENPLIERDILGNLITSQNMMHFKRTDLFNAKDYEPFIIELDREHFKSIQTLRKSGEMAEAASLNRSIEHTDKIAHIICICNGERMVTRAHLELAHTVVQVSNRKVFSLLKQSTASKDQRDVARIVDAVRRGGGQVKRSVILKNSHLGSRAFKDVINTAIDLGLIIECESLELMTNGKRTGYLKLI